MRFSLTTAIALLLLLLTQPAFAQVDCLNIPTSAEAVSAEYAACVQPPSTPEVRVSPTDNAIGLVFSNTIK